MDQLQQLVKTLRVLARTNEPNRVASVEKAIDEYLDDKAGIVRLSLERLCDAIEREEAENKWPEASFHQNLVEIHQELVETRLNATVRSN